MFCEFSFLSFFLNYFLIKNIFFYNLSIFLFRNNYWCYKLTSLITLLYITGCILTNLIFFSTCIYFMWCLFLKILFCYLLDIYCNEIKFVHLNDLIFKWLNSNKTQYKILLQNANSIWCNFFKCLGIYVIFTRSSS